MTNLALVGVGKWGLQYVRTIKSLKNCRLKYLCNPHVNSLGRYSNEYIIVDNYRKLFNYSDIDGVIIASSSQSHFSIARDFIKKGMNILVEKPIVESLLDAQKLKKVYKEKGVLSTGYIYLYNSAFNKCKEDIKKIGQIKYIESYGGKYGYNLNGVSSLWEWASHDVSMCLYMLEKIPYEVSCRIIQVNTENSNKADLVLIHLRYKNNVESFIKAGWLSTTKERTFSIFGTKGILKFDDHARKKLVFIDSEKNVKKISIYSSKSPLKEEIEAFISCIENKAEDRCNFDFTFNVTKILEYALLSSRKNGKAIKIS